MPGRRATLPALHHDAADAGQRHAQALALLGSEIRDPPRFLGALSGLHSLALTLGDGGDAVARCPALQQLDLRHGPMRTDQRLVLLQSSRHSGRMARAGMCTGWPQARWHGRCSARSWPAPHTDALPCCRLPRAPGLGFLAALTQLTLLDLGRSIVHDFAAVEECPSLCTLVIGGRQPMRLPSLLRLPALQVGHAAGLRPDLSTCHGRHGADRLCLCRWSVAVRSGPGMSPGRQEGAQVAQGRR